MTAATPGDSFVANLAPGSRIAVFRALQLGDMLCAVPALRALRTALPQAHIALIGLPWARDFVARFSAYLDEFIPFPGWPGLPERGEDVKAAPAFIAAMQARRFDAAIQLHGAGTLTNPLTALFNARLHAGFYREGEWCPAAQGFMPFPAHGRESQRLLALTEHLGAAGRDVLEFPLTDADAREASALVAANDIDPVRLAVVHVGARGRTRRWGAARFAAVIDALAQHGFHIALTGAASERALVDEVVRATRARIKNLCGATSLGGLAALLKQARFLVCNDTGVSHIAAALRVPSVVVVMGSDPARWAPGDSRRHRVVAHAVPCRPCGYDECAHDFACAAGVSTAQVVDTALSLVREVPSYAA